MSLANVVYNATYTWADPSAMTLEAQMSQPMFNEHPVELGLSGRSSPVLAFLSGDPDYRRLFRGAFPEAETSISIDHVVKAIASFERTLLSGRSNYDRYVFDDERTALSDSAKRGMSLFYSSRVGCAQCHYGLTFSGQMRYEGHLQVTARYANTGLYSSGDRGLIDQTHDAGDMGRFRVPSLRNVALTAPYMHDGSIATLAEVIDHYASGGRERSAGKAADNHLIDRQIHPLQLSALERADLLAFLQSLTDPGFTADHGCPSGTGR